MTHDLGVVGCGTADLVASCGAHYLQYHPHQSDWARFVPEKVDWSAEYPVLVLDDVSEKFVRSRVGVLFSCCLFLLTLRVTVMKLILVIASGYSRRI